MVPDFDLFTYSSPCQDFSQAGLQKGGEKGSGTRSSLLWECERAIAAKKPKYLLMENVAALVSEKFIKLFNRWQLTLENLGYKNFAAVLNAKHYGVPQNRERVFLVSILDAEAKYEFPKPVKLEKRLKDVLEVDVDERYYLKVGKIENLMPSELCAEIYKDEPKMILGSLQDHASKQMIDDDTSCPTIGTTDLGLPKGLSATDTANEPNVLTPKRTEYGKEIRKQYEAHEISEQRKNIQQLEPRTDGISNTLTGVQKDNYLAEPECRVVGRLSGDKWDKSLDIMRRVYDENGLAPTQHTAQGGNMETKICVNQPKTGASVHPLSHKMEFKGDESINENIAPTLRATDYKAPVCWHQNYRIRKLTERECFRLMDVCDADIDKIQAAKISRTQQYKLAGNSIVVAVLVAIFNKMFVDTTITELKLFY